MRNETFGDTMNKTLTSTSFRCGGFIGFLISTNYIASNIPIFMLTLASAPASIAALALISFACISLTANILFTGAWLRFAFGTDKTAMEKKLLPSFSFIFPTSAAWIALFIIAPALTTAIGPVATLFLTEGLPCIIGGIVTAIVYNATKERKEMPQETSQPQPPSTPYPDNSFSYYSQIPLPPTYQGSNPPPYNPESYSTQQPLYPTLNPNGTSFTGLGRNQYLSTVDT